MSDLIDRQAVIDLIEHYNSDALGTVFIDYAHGEKLANEVKNIPSVTPTEMKSYIDNCGNIFTYPTERIGHWIDDNADEMDAKYGRHLYRCSECNKYADNFVGGTEDWWDIDKPKFCPHCGCRMVEPQESEEISDRNMKMWEEIFKAESEGKE